MAIFLGYLHHSLSLAPMLEQKALCIKVFGSASAGSYGMEMEFDLARAQKDSICAMVKSRYIGDGHPTFNRESL